MGISFKTLNTNEEIPRVGYTTLARWQSDIYEILKNTDINCVVIEYIKDEGD